MNKHTHTHAHDIHQLPGLRPMEKKDLVQTQALLQVHILKSHLATQFTTQNGSLADV